MSLWRQFTRGLRVLTNRRDADTELDDEIRHYIDETEAAARANGLSPAEARRAARLEIGNMTVVREEVRAYGWEHAIGTLVADLRYASRRLRRSAGFTAVSAITLAVGIGATTAIFSAVKAVLLEGLPYPQASRIAVIADATADGERLDVTFGTYRELAQRSRGFEALAPFKPWQPTIVGGAEPERLSGARVGADFFRALGVSPHIGRDFYADDDRPNGANVTILSHALWRRRFDADPAIVGRSITLDDAQYLVVGVMPRAFENVLAPSTELWAPLQYSTVFGPDSREWGHHLRLLARLRPDVGIDTARQELNQIAGTPVAEFSRVPWARLENGLIVRSLQADVTQSIRPALIAVLGGVVLLLAIACVNVTNLLLARGAQRRGEFAMRVALGAGRGRLFRQVLTESVLLSLIGGALAMMVAAVALPTLVALAPPELPRLGAIRLDVTIFALALLLTTIVGAVVGLIPAMQAARQDLQTGTQETSRRTAGGHRRTRRLLVVAEVAIALVLLTGAGLLLRSIDRVFAAPVGFDPSGLLTMQVQQSGKRYRLNDSRSQFYDRAIDAVRAVPGVSTAAFTSLVPLSGEIDIYGVHLESDRGPEDDGAAMRYAVTADYFEVMRIPLRSGRLLNTRDTSAAPRAAVISETFASRRFAGREALGQRFRFGPPEGDWYTVVGVVGDVKQSALDLYPPDAIYIPVEQWHWVDTLMTLVVRGRDEPAALAPTIRSAIWSVDKDVPIVRIATLDALVERAIGDRRFALVLFEAFGLAALILVTTGIYGVLSGSVTERMRESGVRSALGASPRDIVGLVVRDGLAVSTLGVVFGLAGAATASRALVALLFGISPLDPVTYASVVALLLSASAVACSAPAYRAASINPAVTLRAE
jgi:putative ABC transport system permease protein